MKGKSAKIGQISSRDWSVYKASIRAQLRAFILSNNIDLPSQCMTQEEKDDVMKALEAVKSHKNQLGFDQGRKSASAKDHDNGAKSRYSEITPRTSSYENYLIKLARIYFNQKAFKWNEAYNQGDDPEKYFLALHIYLTQYFMADFLNWDGELSQYTQDILRNMCNEAVEVIQRGSVPHELTEEEDRLASAEMENYISPGITLAPRRAKSSSRRSISGGDLQSSSRGDQRTMTRQIGPSDEEVDPQTLELYLDNIWYKRYNKI